MAGVLSLAVAAAHLVSDREPVVRNQKADEFDTGLTSLELPILSLAVLLTIMLAIGGT
jgi:hypothetical protein